MSQRALLASLLVLLLAIATPGFSQEVTVPDTQRLAELERLVASNETLSDADRSELQATLAKTSEAVKRSQQQHAELSKLQERVASADAKIEDYRRRVSDIEQAPQTARMRLGANPSLEDINAEIALVRAERDAWAEDRKKLMAEARLSSDSGAEAQNRLTKIASELEALTPVPNNSDSVQAVVSSAFRAARRDALLTEKALLELQLRASPSLSALRTARGAWLDAAITEADNLITALRAQASNRRETVSAQRQAETRRILSDIDTPNETLIALRDQNLAYIEQNQSLTERLNRASENADATRRSLDIIEQDAAWTNRRLAIASSDATLKEVLQTRLASLPDTRKLKIDNSE